MIRRKNIVAFFFGMSVLSLILVSACSDDDFNSENSDGSGGFSDLSTTCSAGEIRCAFSAHQVCKDGVWTTDETCKDPLVCDANLGCVDCIPSTNTCKDGNVHSCNSDGTVGNLVQECPLNPCVAGECGTTNCADGADLVYVIDVDYNLHAYYPKDNTLKKLFELDCPCGNSLRDPLSKATPFSMSVDRNAIAWVLYDSGEIFNVNTQTGACAKTSHSPGQDGFELFGMGFVSDSKGSTTEKLYIFGGDKDDIGYSGKLAYIDPATINLTTIGSIDNRNMSPELTGTGEGRFFAFFPGANGFVAEVDKATGMFTNEWSTPITEDFDAWAFAHWGGQFFIFITTYEGVIIPVANSKIMRLDPVSKKFATIKNDLGFRIVGAGVSTCAPIVIE